MTHTLLSLFLAAQIGAAQDAFVFPDTPAGQVARAWFEAFHSDEDGALAAFEETYRDTGSLAESSAVERAARLEPVQATVGRLTPQALLDEQPLELTLLVESSKVEGIRLEVRFELEPEPPHKLVAFGLQPAATAAPVGPYSYEGDLTALLTRARNDAGVPALAALLIRDGVVVDRAAVGTRRAEAAEPVTLRDPFHLGSLTKAITATMLARLVEAGDLTWDTSLGAGLEGLEMHAAYRQRTLHELLGHRAGIASYLTFDADQLAEQLEVVDADGVSQRAAFVAHVLREAPASEGAFLYSNAGYAVAARLGELAAGRSWIQLVHDLVLEPADMGSAGLGWPATNHQPAAPWGHFEENGQLRPQGLDEYPFAPFITPAGHLHASVEDVGRFALEHLRGLRGEDGLLKASTVQRLHTPAPGGFYAGGWMIDALEDGGTRHWHDGSAGTFYASVQLFPERNAALVVLTNAGQAEVVSAVAAALTPQARAQD